MFKLDPQAQRRKTANRRNSKTENPYLLEGVDMRSSSGRRYRDIVDGVIRDFPSANDDAVRALAGLRFTQENLQAQIVNGPCPARVSGDIVRVANLVARKEKELRETAYKARGGAVSGPTIEDYLVRHEPDDDEGDEG